MEEEELVAVKGDTEDFIPSPRSSRPYHLARLQSGDAEMRIGNSRRHSLLRDHARGMEIQREDTQARGLMHRGVQVPEDMGLMGSVWMVQGHSQLNVCIHLAVSRGLVACANVLMSYSRATVDSARMGFYD